MQVALAAQISIVNPVQAFLQKKLTLSPSAAVWSRTASVASEVTETCGLWALVQRSLIAGSSDDQHHSPR
jgi:hypothetical protein